MHPKSARDRRIRLSDARALGYTEWGDPGGAPVLGFHGTGLSRLAHLGDAAPRAAKVRLILPDRPGYGLSDEQPGRTLLDWARDAGELADALAIERFAVFGYSGGGPYALACAAALPERVTAVGLVSAVGPVIDDHEVRACLSGPRRALVDLARTDPDAAARAILRECEEDADMVRRDPDAGLGAWSSAPELDRALLADPAIRTRLAASLHETASRGSGGPARDLTLLYTKPWGFRPGLDVRVPVYLWHGDLDATVPVGVARVVARALPRCSARIEPGRGHLLLWAVAGEVLGALAAAR